jgi:hypothetical protein
MLEVELDVYSGMPNPRWILSSNDENELLDRLVADPAQISPVASADEQFSLGYRGLIVREVKPDGGPWSASRASQSVAFPSEFRVGSKEATTAPTAGWLLDTATTARRNVRITDEVREVVSDGVSLVLAERDAPDPSDPSSLALSEGVAEPGESAMYPTSDGEGAHQPAGSDAIQAGPDPLGPTWWACASDYFSANASFFNRPENVTRNNCYCFASNHLAGVRYALPGRRGGRPASSITCGGVTDGLRADGWKDGCQTNGLTLVLVIWPRNDYHFYRLVTSGPSWWWGHKPGGTPAKYTDDCGHGIYQYNGGGYAPNNCCRGRYTDFCGYFYQNNSTAFVA